MPDLEKINNIGKGGARILFAPLDWGLGHTTRCLPIIKAFQLAGAEVNVACNQHQAHLLEGEIPGLRILSLDGYGLHYSKSKWLTWASIALQAPKILTAIKSENRWLAALLRAEKFDVVISDNRFGFHHPGLHSIFITHQLRIRVPLNNWVEDLIQKWNYRFIQKFDECWIPDFEKEPTLSGSLSHPNLLPAMEIKYIGPISRFKKNVASNAASQELVVVISGPEPQRTIFENLIIPQLRNWNGKAVVVRGLPSETNTIPSFENISVYNH